MARQERHLLVCGADPALDWQRLQRLLASGAVVGLCRLEEEQMLRAALRPTWLHRGWQSEWLIDGDSQPVLAEGAKPAVVIGSGGSGGGRRWCLQPWEHLQGAAQALVGWPGARNCSEHRAPPLSFNGLANPLPLHHISGLMPPLRSQAMAIPHCFLPGRQWRQVGKRPPLHGWGISLVPTQLQDILGEDDGVDWLAQLTCCWVGGASMAPSLGQKARQAGLKISPCYGSTETGAMVAALDPHEFLSGVDSCGFPLSHVELRIASAGAPGGALEIRSPTLTPGFLVDGQLQPLPQDKGWWRSNDQAHMGDHGLQVLGRLDGAINSGGEMVFPEILEASLMDLGGLEAVLILGVEDPRWGQRLVGLYRGTITVGALENGVSHRPPAERPKQWIHCPSLAPNGQGKWERYRWQTWLKQQQP